MTEAPIHLTDSEFESRVLEADLPVLVDFWAPWCGPCRFVAPVLDELARDYAGRLVVAKINTEREQENAGRLRVSGIPTLVLFDQGREVDRLVGALPGPALERWIDQALTGE